MKIEFNEYGLGACILGGVCGLVGLGFGLYSSKKASSTAKLIGVSVEKLKDMTEVEVSDQLVKNTVQNKVNKVVTEMVSDATRKAVDDVKSDMHKTIANEVKAAVKDRSDVIEEGIKREYESLLADIDVDDLKREIKREAREKIMARMGGVLEEVKEMANSELRSKLSAYNDIGKIAKNILGN